MENFERKSFCQLMKLEQKELEKYYLNLRKYNYEHNVPLKNIKIRKNIHKLLLSIVKLDRLLNKEKIVIIGDERVNSPAPKIYACTHIGGKDIERSFEAIKDPCYLFFGDPGIVYRNSVGLLLHLNGVICLETRNKEDRKIAKSRAIELLNKGGNLLIYPEGAWNITENLPVMKLFNGTVEMAIETGAEIIPIAIEQYDDTHYFWIGKNINYSDYNVCEAKKLTSELRDVLSTLKWKIWESFSILDRKEIDDEYRKGYAQNIVDKCEFGYTIQDVLDTRFKDKNVTDEEEVYEFQKKLIPSKNNGFLLRKVR